MSDSIISPELIFITGSFARDREYRKGADIDLIYLTKNSGRVYSESFVVGNVRFQMTFMPSSIVQIRESESLINQYENRLFKVQSLPKINLSATLPSLTNSISPIAISDGSEQFVNRFYMSSSISMTISQLIPFTGGTVSLTSGLTRLDNFSPQRTKSFKKKLN